jgi:hypothetical protein
MMNNNRTKMGEWSRRKTKSMREQESLRMLTEFLNAHTPQQKREVIRSFNPLYFVFGETLNPRKEEPHEDNICETNPTNLQGQGENHARV